MKDILIKGLLNSEAIIYACDITQMAKEAREIHRTMPVGSIVLGRTLAAATMMCAMLKNPSDKLTLMLNGGGEAGTIMAVGDADLNMKSYIANPKVNTMPINDQFNIVDAVGKKGTVTVIRDTGHKEPYVGKTEIVSGEIGEDIARYFLDSEQQNSIVYVNTWLETDTTVLNAGGIIIRPLPNCTEGTLLQIESRIKEIKNYAIYLLQESAEAVVKKIFSTVDIIERKTPHLYCDCNRQRLEEVLISLGEKELEDMIKTDNKAQLVCRFCNKKYDFDGNELTRLLKLAVKG